MKIETYIFIFLAAAVTTVIGVKSASEPIAFAAVGFIVWAVSPYIYLAVMANLVSTNTAKSGVLSLSLLAGLFGIWFIVDAMFIHPDAQGGLIFIFVPFIQWAVIVLASIPIYFLGKVKKV